MADIFLPKVDPVSAKKRYREAKRAARMAVGDYVIHIADNGSQQVLLMHFQDMPDETQAGLELNIVASGPVLRGLSAEFEEAPQIYRDGSANSMAGKRGSRFVVDATVYDVKKVDTNHLGGVTIMLTQSRDCDVKDLEFYDQVRPFICWQGHK